MTTNLWRLIAGEVNRQAGRFQRTVTAADISRATEGRISPQVLSKWKNKPTTPEVENLVVVRDVLRIPWADLLDAILTDKGYLPEPARSSRGLDRLARVSREQAAGEKASEPGGA